MMTLRRLGHRFKNQRGFTLVELLLGIAIASIICGGITMGIYQVFDGSSRSITGMSATKEIENAIHRITPDAQMAESVTMTAPSGFPLTLTWIEWNNNSHNVTYSVQNGQLKRSQSVNGGQPTETILIPHLNPDSQMTNCQFSSGVFTFKITATIGGFRPASETRSFNIISRSTP
jgi:prepilin-type N-terminal cleavage/methylation domain-containing protein